MYNFKIRQAFERQLYIKIIKFRTKYRDRNIYNSRVIEWIIDFLLQIKERLLTNKTVFEQKIEILV